MKNTLQRKTIMWQCLQINWHTKVFTKKEPVHVGNMDFITLNIIKKIKIYIYILQRHD